MGGSKKQTIGYQYFMGLHSIVCKGPIDALLGIKAGDLDAWAGQEVASGSIVINAPDLFGGTKREGGIQGKLSLMFGEATQPKNAYLVSQLGERQPAYRGVFGTVFEKGMVAAMNPYLKAWAYRVRRNTKGWYGDNCWYPEKASVQTGTMQRPTWVDIAVGLLDNPFGAIVNNILGGPFGHHRGADVTVPVLCANLAHIVYEILTDPNDGMGYPRSRIDDASFRAAADIFYDEGLGLFATWTQSGSIDQMIQNLIDHGNAMVIEDPDTRLFRMIAMRGGYDVTTLQHYGPRTGPDVKDPSIVYDVGCVLESFERTSADEIVNEVTVKWKESATNKDDAVTIQNPAALAAAGGVINQTKTYAACPTKAIALRLCQRDLDILSTPLARVRIRCNRRAKAYPGKVIRFSWPEIGILNLAVRVLRISTGNLDGGEITIEGTEDVYKFGQATYVKPQDSAWVPPTNEPVAPPAMDAFEIPYRDLVQIMGATTANAQDVDACYLGMASQQPPNTTTYGVQLFEKTGAADFTDAGKGDFTPTGILHDAIGPKDTTITLDASSQLYLAGPGTVAFIGAHPTAEAVEIKTVTGNVLTIGRGVIDTTPKLNWPAGTRFWAYDNYGAASKTEYTTAEVVTAKAATNASAGQLAIAAAPSGTVTMAQRQARPYPPGNLKINGIAYPAMVPTGLVLTWSHRSRLLQADSVVDTTAGSIGPEPGTTYTVRVYLAGVLKSTDTGITVATFTPAAPAGGGSMRIEVDAVRGGITSWQTLTATFVYGMPEITTPYLTFVAGIASERQLTAQFGSLPYTWSAGTLPAGVTISAGGLVKYDGSGSGAGLASIAFTATDVNGTPGTKSIPFAINTERRMWRLNVTAGNGTPYVRAIEIEMRTTAGGAQQATGGVAFATTSFSGQPASAAFDGYVDDDGTHRWTSSGAALPQAIGYYLPTPKQLMEISLVGDAPSPMESQSIKAFTVQSSADSTTGLDGTWVDEWSVAGQSGWGGNTPRIFTRPEGIPVKILSTSVKISNSAAETAQLLVSGGYGALMITSTALPSGITMDSGGLLTNDGSAADATTSVTFTATDINGKTDSKSMDLVVAALVVSRYWRIRVDSMPSGNDGYAEISRVRMLKSGVNISITGATATASSNYGTRYPSNLIKASEAANSDDTWTSGTGASLPHWVTFDTGTAIEVDEFKMYSADLIDSPARYPESITIQISTDGSTWTDQVAFTGMTGAGGAYQSYPLI